MAEDRTLELHTNASHGALEYLRLARDSLACITGEPQIDVITTRFDRLMKSVENFHTIVHRKHLYQQRLETKHGTHTGTLDNRNPDGRRQSLDCGGE